MQDIFEIKDTEINVEELMDKIRAAIEEKKNSGVISREKIAKAEKLKIGEAPQLADFTEHYIQTSGILCNIDIDNYKFGIPPFLNHPLLGHMVLAGKGLIRRFIRFHTRGVFNQQIDFNRHMVQLIKGLYERIDDLEKEISALRRKEEQ